MGPDNGLLALAIAMLGDVTAAIELDNPNFHIPTYSSTFDGRDIFGPVSHTYVQECQSKNWGLQYQNFLSNPD